MPQEFPAAAGEDDPIARFDTTREAFAAALRDLHIQCGKPKQSVLVQAANRSAAAKSNDRFRLHPGTLSQVLSGKKTPTHDFLSALILQLVQARPTVGEYNQVWPAWDRRWQGLMRLKGEADRARQRNDAAQQAAEAEAYARAAALEASARAAEDAEAVRAAAAEEAARIIADARQKAQTLTDEAARILAEAHEQAERARIEASAEAREDATRIIADARREAESIISAASDEAAGSMAGAREETQTARADAARHVDDAHERVETVRALAADETAKPAAGDSGRTEPADAAAPEQEHRDAAPYKQDPGASRYDFTPLVDSRAGGVSGVVFEAPAPADAAGEGERASAGVGEKDERTPGVGSDFAPRDLLRDAWRELQEWGEVRPEVPSAEVHEESAVPYVPAGRPARLDTVLFRWMRTSRSSWGFQPVAYSVDEGRAQDLRERLAPLMRGDDGRSGTPSVVRYILDSGEAAVIHRMPTADQVGRPCTIARAVIGPAGVLSASRVALLDYPDPALLESLSGSVQECSVERLFRVQHNQARYIEQIPLIRQQLEVVTAQLLRTSKRRLSIRRPANIHTLAPMDVDFGHLLIWGLCTMLERVVGEGFFTYASYDMQDSLGLRLVCVPQWTVSAQGDGSLVRIDPGDITQDGYHQLACELVRMFLENPDRPEEILGALGLNLDLGLPRTPQQRLEEFTSVLWRARRRRKT
ncbi:hypothetical protein [Streptomyces sp. NPDC093094]|uniref:hypothetical protein n=1 Tax=Streptomyces sp. NPDC093094 TaxID=3366026 RepID=UPI0037F8E352